jgi:hypothetical protein
MARVSGCAGSFHLSKPPRGVQSAGWCLVNGHRVDLRVQRFIDTANPWLSGSGARVTPGFIGNGWQLHSADVAALDTAGDRLSSSRH